MTNLKDAVWVELLKVRRSRIPLMTVLAFLVAPIAGAFFMVVLKDPEMARQTGLISAKAQLVAGQADWPTYLGFLSQATAVGGILLFGFIAAWVFGREFAEGTITDLLAVPTPRSSIVTAKFLVVALWSAAVAMIVYAAGIALGAFVGLSGFSAAAVVESVNTVSVVALMVIVLQGPIALVAGIGRGYLAPLGAAVLTLVAAQIVAAAGWGAYFPWSIPALRAGLVGLPAADLAASSYVIVAAVSAAGAVATYYWWERADHT